MNTDKQQSIPTVVRLQATIGVPTDREQTLRDALKLLPDVSVECLDGFNDACDALTKLRAAEELVASAEESLRAASVRLRKSISSQWDVAEIPGVTISVLNVW